MYEAPEFQVRGGVPNVLRKLEAGEDVTVAFYGSSITWEEGWRPLTHAWLATNWPAATVRAVEAAVGGTNSELGVFRLEQDVLRFDPDLVFVEFATNDSSREPGPMRHDMENIVRKIRRHNPCCDICFVYTVGRPAVDMLLDGKCPQSVTVHEEVAAHYDLPSVWMGVPVAKMIAAGEMVYTGQEADKRAAEAAGKLVFSRDSCHPWPGGAYVYLQAIVHAFAAMAEVSASGPVELPEPLDADLWEDARFVPLTEGTLVGDWTELTDPADWPQSPWNLTRLPTLYRVSGAGSGIDVCFTGTVIGFFQLLGADCGRLEGTLDGRPIDVPAIHAGCWRPVGMVVARGLEPGEHSLSLRLSDTPPDKSAVISKSDSPARIFAPNDWLPAAIMIAGSIRK